MKFILFLSLLLLPIVGQADIVTQYQAKELAIKFLKSSKETRSQALSLEMVYDGMDSESRSSIKDAPFYVFNNTQGTGFVIISGEDASMPVLGYSVDNNFTNGAIPSNVHGWLDGMRQQILQVREDGIQPTSTVKKAWENVSSRSGSVIIQHQTARWNQGSPYNDDCFVINGERALTGCAATATAIVMRFHQWPDEGVGVLPSYQYEYNGVLTTVPSRPLKAYNWNNMPMELSENSLSAQKQAVAQLMSDCGVMIQAMYGPKATAASLDKVNEALGQYMKYDKSSRCIRRETYTNEEWHGMLQYDLQNFGPVIYSGFSDSSSPSGHAFVLDGYTSDRYYSTNWGWGGFCNGFYLLDAMDPMSDGQIYGEYSKDQKAIFGVRKDENGAMIEEVRFEKWYPDKPAGLRTTNSIIKKNVPFIVSVNYVSNVGTVTIKKPKLLVALTNQAGDIKLDLSTIALNDLPPKYGYIGDVECTITCDILPGDRIRLFYQAQGENTRKLVKGNVENDIPWEIIVKAEGEDITPLGKCVSLEFDKTTKVLQLELKE